MPSTLSQVRRMSGNLRPVVLKDLGLGVALQNLARELESHLAGVKVCGEIVRDPVCLLPELELTTYRIAQESLNNVRKHAATASTAQMGTSPRANTCGTLRS